MACDQVCTVITVNRESKPDIFESLRRYIATRVVQTGTQSYTDTESAVPRVLARGAARVPDILAPTGPKLMLLPEHCS